MNQVTNVLLSGVGGQGILLASRMLSTVALKAGLDVKSADVHGMAQRGGSVTSQLRFGPHVHSPLLPEGEIDFLVALEKLEALRYAHLVRTDTRVYVNDQIIVPVSVSMGMGEYPQDIDEQLQKQFSQLRIIDCLGIANELGNFRVANVILLGALSVELDFGTDLWESVIQELVKPQFVEINTKAFHLGRERGKS